MTLAVAGKAGAAEGHWAFQQVKRPAVPVIDSAWPSIDIDRFVLANLRENKMQPARRADRRYVDPPIVIRPRRPAAIAGGG